MVDLGRWWRQARQGRRPDSSGPVGLVLSGGGARSSFQIGALRYLYDVEQIEPSIITGTSAGSILGSVLAQYGDHASQRAALDDLEQIWLAMRASSDMFTEYPWFARLREHMPTWRKVLALRQRSARVDGAEQGGGWSPSTAWEALGTLWEAGRSSADLQLIARGPTQERAAFAPGPIVDRLLEVFSAHRLAQSPVTLRVALVSLESGELRFVTNTGALTDRQNVPLPELGDVDVVEAIRASCSIPGVFPPVPLAGEHYVDGGVRENLPAQMAVDHLGAGRCYAVVASPSGARPMPSFATTDMFGIIMRSASGIMSDELQRDEIAYAQAQGVVVINPTVDVHDLVTIDPGLVRIAVDYGYMRARDVLREADAERCELTDAIITTRRRAWEMEEAAFAQGAAAESDVMAVKAELRDLMAGLEPDELPPGAEHWWRQWERHAFDIEREMAPLD